MVYETLINSTIISKPCNKPNYTPKQSLKKALRLVRRLFKKSALKHSKLENELQGQSNEDIQLEESLNRSIEECDNYENELLELLQKSNK